MQFIITGGVEPEEANLRGWFSAGATAVGMGSKLITKSSLESKDYSKITALAKEALSMIQTIKK
jgi:2-dehydro-3-deoxyphosphogluconate aldolase/(4S)-4-hydroxy-2-oxoglutarate aldolase